MDSRIHIRVLGEVQGVFFRAGVQEVARSLAITGWARNVEDGSVEVIAEGPRERLAELLDWCSHGPSGASVSQIEHEWLEATGEFSEFGIRY